MGFLRQRDSWDGVVEAGCLLFYLFAAHMDVPFSQCTSEAVQTFFLVMGLTP